MPLRVVVADNSLVDREGVLGILERRGDLEIAAVVGDLDSRQEAIGRLVPDIVVTELLTNPFLREANVARMAAMRLAHPRVGLLAVSRYRDARFAPAIFEGGMAGRGYLLKDGVTDEGAFADAVTAVASGGTVIDPLVIDLLIEYSSAGGSAIDRLSSGHVDVLAELASGKSNAAIAMALNLNRRVVEHRVDTIYARLNLRDRGDTSRRVAATLLYLEASRLSIEHAKPRPAPAPSD